MESCDAKDMLAYQHSGLSVNAGVCTAAQDRAELERLLRYCARPTFACARLRKAGSALVYRCAKQHSAGCTGQAGRGADRASHHGRGRAWGGAVGQCDSTTPPEPSPSKRSLAHYLWAVLIARISEVFPLCPLWEDCDAQTDEDSRIGPDWDVPAQPAPDYEVNQRINW